MNIIGQWCIANVTEPIWMVGTPIYVRGIIKGDAPEESEGAWITDEETLADLGGIEPGDLADVQPYIAREKRASFVSELVEARLLEPTDAPEVVMPD